MREFGTGATRDDNTEKPDYKGFLSARAIQRFGEYMHKHRKQADGSMRGSDNWKNGIPIPAYEESLVRHMIDFMRLIEDGKGSIPEAEDLACAVWFNLQGWLHETLKNRTSEFVIANRSATQTVSSASFLNESELRYGSDSTRDGLGNNHVLSGERDVQGSKSPFAPSGQTSGGVLGGEDGNSSESSANSLPPSEKRSSKGRFLV